MIAIQMVMPYLIRLTIVPRMQILIRLTMTMTILETFATRLIIEILMEMVFSIPSITVL